MSKLSPEDLINVVIAADVLKRKARGQNPPRYQPSQRIWVEPFFNLVGDLFGRLMYLLPWRYRKPYVQWVMRKMAARAPEQNPYLAKRIWETIDLGETLREKTGEWPALLVVMSHPETEGPLEWVRFEEMRQGISIADAYIEAQHPERSFLPHPKLLLAIDPFALDTLSTPVAGFYGGWMRRIYLAYDRQPSTQSWIQRKLFLRHSNYAHIGWKLLRLLRNDVPVLMALGGGLPQNARLLYCVREFVHHLRPQRWRVSKRAAQLELMKILMQPVQNTWPPESGDISLELQRQIKNKLQEWGLEESEARAALAELVEEFKLPVPYRIRLLRMLRERLANSGKPLILLPVSHGPNAPHVTISSPIALESGTWDFRPFSKTLANIFA